MWPEAHEEALEFANGDAGAVNESQIHIDFMIGSEALEITGLTRDGDRVPVLTGGRWQV